LLFAHETTRNTPRIRIDSRNTAASYSRFVAADYMDSVFIRAIRVIRG
jgi:hypothetical protein